MLSRSCFLFCSFFGSILAQRKTLWAINQGYSSQLLDTIRDSADIIVNGASNITAVLEDCGSNDCTILYLASNYPNSLTPISLYDYSLILNKSANIYMEYPSCILTGSATPYECQSVSSADIRTAQYERAVVVSSELSPLTNYTIIDLHQASWININSFASHINKQDLLMMAKVAGYDNALYHFNQTTPYPLLYKSDTNNILTSLTSFSNYSLARYVPSQNTRIVLTYIINQLLDINLEPSQISWIDPPVQPTFSSGYIPTDITQSFQRGVQWIYDSKLLAETFVALNTTSGLRPTPSDTASIGDGSNGLLEGFSSGINVTGGQMQSTIVRTDCQGEIAGSLAWSGYLFDNEHHANTSYNLLHFIYNTSIAQQQERNDPSSSAYGLLLWGVNAPIWNTTVYCDDNARAILGTMMATALLHGNKYNLNADVFVANIVRAILGNFRLTSTKGFCPSSVTMDALNKNGWQMYWNGSYEFDDPHYESWIWCSYLFTYYFTQYEPMYERTVIGMENIMHAFYSGTLHWANGLTQEYARLLLPLSFLNRIENRQNKTHLQWLYDVGNELNKYHINGTIEEHYGDLKYGNAKPPQNNPQYGTTEAPLEQMNGNPVSDALYTLPFAVWGLHEAYLLTSNETLFGNLLQDLVRYLMNIQSLVDANNAEYSYLNGTWFRGFDFERNDYFASASDIGWGPYSIESGWTVGEILSSFAMVMSNHSFFDVVNNVTLYNFSEDVQHYLPIFGLPVV